MVVTTCESCGRGFQHSKGELVELEPGVVEMIACDAQRIDAPVIESAERDPNDFDDARSSDEVAHVDAARSNAGTRGSGLAGGSRSSSKARDVSSRKPRPAGGKSSRATQDTPPAIRRQVFLRDRGRCVVPGCRCTTYVDLHHLDLRSDGGSNDPENLVVLCGAHHRALHTGRLTAEGTPSTGLRFRHADRTIYGRAPSPALSDVAAQTFAALRGLGFKEKPARDALTHALSSSPPLSTVEQLLRAALQIATARSVGAATRRAKS